MLAELRPAFEITRREVRDQLRDWRIIFPVLALTIFFPFLMEFTASQMLNFVNRYGATLIGERLVPFLLMIVGFFPISVSLVIALETFVGEKERGSIEPLLNTPLKDWQIYLGKLLAATIPPLFASFVGMGVYLGGLLIGRVPIPEARMLILIFTLTTVQAVMMVAGAVVVSSQATSVRAANLLASFIVIPTAFLIQVESVVMFWGNYSTLWMVVFGLVVLTVLLMRVGLAHFQREELLGREIDVLNLRWGWRLFAARFVGGARSLPGWYAGLFKGTVRSLWKPFLMALGLGVMGFAAGMWAEGQANISLKQLPLEQINGHLRNLIFLWPMFDISPVLVIWWQNSRVLLTAMLLGLFSFGILGNLPLILSMGVVGFVYNLLVQSGVPAMFFAAMVLPHGIIEIPAAVLGTAAVLQAGAVLATPTPGKTVSEVTLESLADWARVMTGLIIPMLLLAAIIEAWVTPSIAAGFIP